MSEFVMKIILGPFVFAAMFTTISTIACLSIRSDNYKINAMLTSICWSIVFVIMKGG